MLDMIRKRDEEEGFTLIELMVVVLIIAILLAIAIPTFLGARNRANDRAAQSSIRNALTAAKVLFTDDQDYTAATTSALTSQEPSLTFQAAGTNSTTAKEVSVLGDNAYTFYGAGFSKSGTCFFIRDISASGVTGAGTMYASVASTAGAGCNASAAKALGAGSWSSKW